MILYGPPGTGKSTIAEKLARRLKFRFLTITPSDFVASGGEEVEARAKAIFAALQEQTELVVLFDEIDSLLLDRNSKLYREQGDVFRLLTPGMLTKLNDLAKRQSVLFIIATNYYERIDAAIKRPGRIDARYLVLPPSATQRREFLKHKKQLGAERWRSLSAKQRKEVVSQSARFTYSELQQLVRQVLRRHDGARDDALAAELKAAIHNAPPMARWELYDLRLQPVEKQGVTEAGANERPWEEYALLAFLDANAGRQVRGEVRERLAHAPLKDELKDAQVTAKFTAMSIVGAVRGDG